MATPTLDTTSKQIGQEKSVIIPNGALDTKVVVDELQQDIEIVTNPNWEAVAIEKFYNELMTIEILPSDHPEAEQVIDLKHNGVTQMLLRGEPKVVKRKFVGILASAKVENIRTDKAIGPSGEDTMKIRTYYTQRYPFRVVEDKNPKGRQWLEDALRETS